MSGTLVSEGTFLGRLIDAAPKAWQAYTAHPFVAGLANGTLPEAAFKYYLEQDYLFLIHFARAYGLAVFKADRLEDMRAASAVISGILDVEMGLHVQYCADWGLTEAEMAELPEDPACMAYTRYVMERGLAGDMLDLHVALAPCVVGYGVIGSRLAADPATKRDGNPYLAWIEMYAGEEYQEVARSAAVHLDVLASRRGGEDRFAALAKTFEAATVLERDFWQMGLNAV